MNKETQEKINQLSNLEQSLQGLAVQRQQFQSQLLEVENAQKEIKSTAKAYRVIGNIMVEQNAEKIELELKEKAQVLQLRIESFEKQEERIKSKAQDLQKEVLEKIREEEKDD